MNNKHRRAGWVHCEQGKYVLPQVCIEGLFVVRVGPRMWRLYAPSYVLNGQSRPDVRPDAFEFYGKARSSKQAMRWAERQSYLMFTNGLHDSHDVLVTPESRGQQEP